MTDAAELIEQAPVQDRDLLQRLSLYFDMLDQRLRSGQGWFIFNASGSRLNRIAGFIQAKLDEDHSAVNSYLMPWRDFAISAYVNEIGLSEIAPPDGKSFQSKEQRDAFEVARLVTDDTCQRLKYSDIVVLVGMQPSARGTRRSFSIAQLTTATTSVWRRFLLTAEMPHRLEEEFGSLDPSGMLWTRLFGRMYETSLVALVAVSWSCRSPGEPTSPEQLAVSRSGTHSSRARARSR